MGIQEKTPVSRGDLTMKRPWFLQKVRSEDPEIPVPVTDTGTKTWISGKKEKITCFS